MTTGRSGRSRELKYGARGEPKPVACVIGWDPIMPFLAGSPIPVGVCEWDVMGGYRGEPADLVHCESVDLEVPASAEIVIEGFINDNPATYEIEGPFRVFTGYVSDVLTPGPRCGARCITGVIRSSAGRSRGRCPARTARTASCRPSRGGHRVE